MIRWIITVNLNGGQFAITRVGQKIALAPIHHFVSRSTILSWDSLSDAEAYLENQISIEPEFAKLGPFRFEPASGVH